MLEGFLDGYPFVRRAWFSAFHISSIDGSIDRQTIEFFAMSDPASFRNETELLLHPPLDFKICGKGAHAARVSSRLLSLQGQSLQYRHRSLAVRILHCLSFCGPGSVVPMSLTSHAKRTHFGLAMCRFPLGASFVLG
jgi:hypothetical protein